MQICPSDKRQTLFAYSDTSHQYISTTLYNSVVKQPENCKHNVFTQRSTLRVRVPCERRQLHPQGTAPPQTLYVQCSQSVRPNGRHTEQMEFTIPTFL